MRLLLRLLLKLVMKLAMLVFMVVLLSCVTRYGQRFYSKATGAPEAEKPKFSSEETDLMSTVFKSALRLFSGQATRNQLSAELSDKLYASRGDSKTMSELGIELVKPGGPAPEGAEGASGTTPAAGASGANPPPTASGPKTQPGMKPAGTAASGGSGSPLDAMTSQLLPGGKAPEDQLKGVVRTDMLGRILERLKSVPLEQWLAVGIALGMLVVHLIRRRGSGSRSDDFVPPPVAMMPAEIEPHEMKHAVHSLSGEEFELLVALIYQRQGYRVSMPAAMSSGRGGDFLLTRKSERLLVQCKKHQPEHKVAVERVRELHEVLTEAGATRGMYVASCGFSWDARNLAKARGMTLISARTLDELLLAAKTTPEEDLLKVEDWAPKLMSRVQFSTPKCPSCEAPMDLHSTSANAVWVCSQRPECRGRRGVRKYQKPAPAPKAEAPAEEEVKV